MTLYGQILNGQGSSSLNNNLFNLITPARLDSVQADARLGFQEHDIPVLIGAKALKPLAKPMPNAVKYFAACEIEALAHNPEWLHKATQTVYDYWKTKNARKTAKLVPFANN